MTAAVERRPWTPEEDAVVLAHYAHLPASEVGAMLGRSRKAISGRAGKLGLSKSPARTDMVPAAPLVAAIHRWGARDARNRVVVNDSRAARDWSAPGTVITCAAADRWLCVIGLLWFDVWPDDPAARAYFEGPEGEDA